MPDEKIVSQIEDLLREVANLGGSKERTGIIPNLEVLDDAPTGLADYIIVADSRDDDAIPAVKVPGIVYAVGDLVNVLFIEGTEPIAIQQASGSSGSNALWQVVAGGSDIYYDAGNVGIGDSLTPETQLDVLVDSADAIPTGGNLMNVDSTILRLWNESNTATYSGFGLHTRTTNSSRVLIGLEHQNNYQGDLFIRFRDAAAGSSEMFRLEYTGSLTLGDGGAGLTFTINGAVTDRNIRYQSNGSNRWILRADATAEGGSNAGSNFNIISRADDGANIGSALFIRRSDRQVGISVSSPAAKLDISQESSSAAVPVTKMNQSDTDEPFILYAGNQTNTTLTNSLVREADVTTATRQGWLKIEIDNTGAGGLSDGDYYMPFHTLA